jgi:hypothetical protein
VCDKTLHRDRSVYATVWVERDTSALTKLTLSVTIKLRYRYLWFVYALLVVVIVMAPNIQSSFANASKNLNNFNLNYTHYICRNEVTLMCQVPHEEGIYS